MKKFEDLSKIEGLSVQFLIVTDDEKLAERGEDVRWESKDTEENKAEIKKWLPLDTIYYGVKNCFKIYI